MNIRQKVKKAYNDLPEGGKLIASQIHGVTTARFRLIVNGEVKDESKMHQALQAIKQASLRVYNKVKDQNNKVQKA